jgi:ATP-dependent Lon protease
MRAGITTVMLPKRNQKDLQDVPEEARQKLQFVALETVDDAMKTALVGPPALEPLPAH